MVDWETDVVNDFIQAMMTIDRCCHRCSMRFDTNFIWAYFAPAILISLVSYISGFITIARKFGPWK